MCDLCSPDGRQDDLADWPVDHSRTIGPPLPSAPLCTKNAAAAIQGQTRAQALCRSSQALYKPILLTSTLLLAGFGVFLASDLVVLIRFGAFSALAISAALASTFVFMPCALAWTGRRRISGA